MIWTKNQKRSIETRIVSIVPAGNPAAKSDRYGPHLYCWTPEGFDAADFADYLAHILAPDCFFSLSLTRANIFFKARFVEGNATGLKFTLPTEVYKVQRREDQRHQIPDGQTLKVVFTDPQFLDRTQSRRVVDISAGGISFLVKDEEHGMFAPNLVLKGIKFQVKGRAIEAEAEVRHKRPTPPHLLDTLLAGTRIGMQFSKISEADRGWIRAWVLEETRKLVSKFLTGI